jgi:hypothetical protein
MIHRSHHVMLRKHKQKFVLGDGTSSIDVSRQITLRIHIDRAIMQINAFVSKSLSTSCILGQDGLRKYSMDVSDSRQTSSIYTTRSSTTIEMDTHFYHHVFSIKLFDEVIIPPCHEGIVRLISPSRTVPQPFSLRIETFNIVVQLLF